MALSKAEIRKPVLPTEVINLASLGGEVVVRGLLLKDRLALFAEASQGGTAHISRLLAATVVDSHGEPIFSVDEWEIFGATQFDDALALFQVARRMSGLDAEVVEKN